MVQYSLWASAYRNQQLERLDGVLYTLTQKPHTRSNQHLSFCATHGFAVMRELLLPHTGIYIMYTTDRIDCRDSQTVCTICCTRIEC